MGSATRIPTCAGKTVLVTGAAGTLGQATAISFAAAGVARLAVVDQVDVLDTRGQALQAALDACNPAPDVLALVVDVCDVASVEAGVREVSSAWDHVDIFVNVAASSSKPAIARGDVTGLRDADARWKVWEANAKGISLMARALVPLLSRGSDRTIVNVATVFSDDLAASAIDSQFSVLALTQISECLMLDNAHEGLLVYSVNPEIDLRGRVPAAVGQVMDVRRSDFIVHLTGRRRDWLAGRHVGSVEDLLELQARDEDSA
ncbi:NAD(P)-binding protein, partial [Colletotrichum somersetense]